MSGGYREHEPSDALKPFVDCLWTRVGRPGLETRVLPDGAVDIIFDIIFDVAAPSPAVAAFVVGTMTATVVVKPSRTCDFVAVRFHPGASQPLFGNSMRELSDRRVDLGRSGPRRWHPNGQNALRKRRTTPSRVRLLQLLLIRRIQGSPPPEPRVREGPRRRWLRFALPVVKKRASKCRSANCGVGPDLASAFGRSRMLSPDGD